MFSPACGTVRSRGRRCRPFPVPVFDSASTHGPSRGPRRQSVALTDRRDGRLDRALYSIASWDNKTLVDIGCGVGFWLPHYAHRAEHAIGIEPDRRLLDLAARRTAGLGGVDVHHGSAEHRPIGDQVADIVHARFAYFFGSGSEAGLAEVERVLAPGGTFLAIHCSWSGGEFAQPLHASTVGNATIDPDETRQWWAERGARRHEVDAAWSAKSNDELERILRIEFPTDVVSDFMRVHHLPTFSDRFAIYEWRPPGRGRDGRRRDGDRRDPRRVPGRGSNADGPSIWPRPTCR